LAGPRAAMQQFATEVYGIALTDSTKDFRTEVPDCTRIVCKRRGSSHPKERTRDGLLE
jgi:hypothetical protein